MLLFAARVIGHAGDHVHVGQFNATAHVTARFGAAATGSIRTTGDQRTVVAVSEILGRGIINRCCRTGRDQAVTAGGGVERNK